MTVIFTLLLPTYHSFT